MPRLIKADDLKKLRHDYIQGRIKFDGNEYDLIDKCPTADAVEVVERTPEIDTALEALNFYRNRFYNEPSGTERHEIANAINTILPLFCKCLK